ncbi:SIMPL domain-containing protein [Trichothermofontia sp.]
MKSFAPLTTRPLTSFAWRRCLPIVPVTIGLLGLLLASPALAQERILRTLTVTGHGVERIPTTLAQVQLGVEVQGATATEVQQEVARRADAMVAFLKSQNVDKLATTGVSLSPRYSYENNRQELQGYVGTNTVSFQVPIAQAGFILDRAVQVGATRIDSIGFIATDSAINAARQQALREATQDAKQQADVVLSTLNLSRQEVVSIQINHAEVPIPRPLVMPASAVAAMKMEDATSPIAGREQEVTASVTLQVRY